MKGKTLRQIMLYNYRYVFAYSFIGIFIAYFLFWQLGSIGPGLAGPETQIAALHTNARVAIETPLYPMFSSLQMISLKVFGISAYTIRIPSIIIAITTLLLLYQILKKWFGKPTALLSVALVATADWYLFTARLATGSIELSFWFVVALLSITKIIEHKSIWTVPLAGSLIALWFVPFGPYLSIALTIGVLSCRIIRERIFEANKKQRALVLLVSLIGAGLLLYTSIQDLNFVKSLLGLEAGIPTASEYYKSLMTNGSSIVAVLPATNPINGPHGVFFVRFFELTFVLFGVFMFWKTRINRLNLILIAITIVLFFISGFSNTSGANSLLVVPFIIFMTAGIRYFIHRWQKTFPKNPYARMAALIPITILLSLTALQHHQSYFILWPHQTTTVNAFSYDLKLAQTELNTADDSLRCTVITGNTDIITLLEASKTDCTLTTQSTVTPLGRDEKQLIAPDIARSSPASTGTVSRALTSASTDQPIRWIVRTQADVQ